MIHSSCQSARGKWEEIERGLRHGLRIAGQPSYNPASQEFEELTDEHYRGQSRNLRPRFVDCEVFCAALSAHDRDRNFDLRRQGRAARELCGAQNAEESASRWNH